MILSAKKLQLEDAAKLHMLVAENIDAIEPGLIALDSRLLLGQTTIDVVASDTNGALVLIATGLTANEELLLKAVEAYSWCREYPESLERLYPSCIISEERPPRLLFVVERMPDAFHRKIKQLGFPEVDCVEFRLLEVEGGSAIYFESVLRLRRPAPAPLAAPAAETVDEAGSGPSDVAMDGVVRERAPVVSMVGRQPIARSRVEPAPLRQTPPVGAAAPAPQPEPVLVPGPLIVTPEPMIATPEPVEVAPAPMIVTPEPVVLPKAAAAPAGDEHEDDLAEQLQSALAALGFDVSTAEVTKSAPASRVVAPEPELIVRDEPEVDFVAESVVPASKTAPRPLPELSMRPSAPITMPRPAPLPAPPQAPRVSLKGLASALLGPGAPASAVDAAVEPALELEPEPQTLELLGASEVAADVVVEAEETAEVEPEAAKPVAQELEGMKFPEGGKLTRQWVEFLSQMSTK
jgi:hypothetical protein